MAHYLYDSEGKLLRAQKETVQEVAVDQAARDLVMTSEQLKFLKYDVARQKFDPDHVFSQSGAASPRLAPPNPDAEGPNDTVVEGFRAHWPQSAQYWRNERLSMKGVLSQQCE